MKKFHLYIVILFVAILNGCVHEPQFSDTPKGNYDACWKILDEHYCFFDYKNIDWKAVYDKYLPEVGPDIKQDSLFRILNKMLGELKDGHVNIYTPFNLGRYWSWFEDYPQNFDSNIQRNYIGTQYGIAGGMIYCMLPDSIGYIYYGSFSSSISESNLDYVLASLGRCRGLIFDIRDNGGGLIAQVNTIAARFIDEKMLTGYIQYKKGKGHNDFSTLYPTYVEPSDRIHFDKRIALLTNRSVFSAANNFVSVMRQIPQVTIIGDSSGGGSGLPFSSELPNGWSIRFSASPIYDAEKKHTEFGIAPDIKVDMTQADMLRGHDTILDTALNYLRDKSSGE